MTSSFLFISSEILVGSDSNTNYALVSPIQVEQGPRLFYPHLGFYYKAANTRLKVILVETASGTKNEIKNSLANPHDGEKERHEEWQYFTQNLTDVSFLSSAWSGSTRTEWQVRIAPLVK